MRKPMRAVVLTVLLLALMSAAALAADASGIKADSISQESGVTLTPVKADGTASTLTDGLYTDAAKVQMTVSGTETGKFYLVLLLKGNSTTPTASNIVYIDQQTGNGGDLTFDLYPSKLEKGNYMVCVASNGSLGMKSDAGSFEFYQAFVRGDVDGNGSITAMDALSALQISAGTYRPEPTETQRLAADADQNGSVTAMDALLILQVSAGTATFD